MNRISAIVLGILILQALACRDSGTDPVKPPPPGKNDYLWTVDTLAYPGSFQTNMHAMYANSATNVYIVGHNDLGAGQMYHFDGTRWTPVGLSVAQGGTLTKPFDLN